MKTFDGKPYASIFREYADCVAQGLLRAYGRADDRGADHAATCLEVIQTPSSRLGHFVPFASKLLRTSDLGVRFFYFAL